MKVKILTRNPDDYMRETKRDLYKVPRNYDPSLHPFEAPREYTRALNAVKLERVFAKPFIGSLDGHREGVSCLCKHPQRLSLLASGDYDGEVRLWNLPTRQCVRRLQAHEGYVRGVAFTPDGSKFLTIGDDKTIKTWNTDVSAFQTAEENVNTILSKTILSGISYNRKKQVFATCGEICQLWEETRNEPVKTFSWGVDSLHFVAFNPIEPSLLATCASDRSIILYDTRDAGPIRKLVMTMRTNQLAWNPMEAFVFTAANEDYKSQQIRSSGLCSTIPLAKSSIVLIKSDQQWFSDLWVEKGHDNVYSYDTRNLSVALDVHKDHTSAVTCVDYAPTGREFVSGSYDKSVRIYNSRKGHSREIYHTKRMQRVTNVLWSLDNKYVLSASDEMNIRVWKSNASEKLGVLKTRERLALDYAETLKKKFATHPQIKRIARHRQVPKHIYNAQRELRMVKEKQKRKEANRRAHSKPGSVPFVAERKKNIVGEKT